MLAEETAAWIQTLRREPLVGENQGIEVCLDASSIERLIPHRHPFRLIDSIDRIDLSAGRIRGVRFIDPTDPVFQGHFPAYPVYPGVLQIEVIGQLALCLASLNRAGSTNPKDVESPINVRATRIHQTVFYDGVFPDDRLVIHAGLVENDDLAGTAAGQIYRANKLCAVSLLEVYYMD